MADWRSIGPTTLPAFEAEIRARAPRSPLLVEVADIYAAVKPHSRLFLGMCWIEDRFQTDPSDNFPLSYHNLMNMKTPDGGGWMQFPSYAAGAKGWIDRITSLTYKNGIYAKTETVEDLVMVYAPPFDNNDVPKYVATIGIIVAELKVLERELGGSPVAYNGPTIPVRWTPVPTSNANHPERTLLPGNLIVIWHENGHPGVTAEDESRFVLNGGGQFKVSYQFAVDHLGAFQMFDCNQLCYHAADGCDNPATDRGCFRGIAIEHVQSHDPAKWAATKRNGAILTAMIIGGHPSIHFGGREGDFSADRIETHKQVSDTKKECPEWMLREGVIESQKALVKSFLAGGTTPTKPPTKYAKPTPIPGEVVPRVIGDKIWLPLPKRQWTALRDVDRHQYAEKDSALLGKKIKKGQTVTLHYSVFSDDILWFVSKGGVRVEADAFVRA